jgi:predicted Fe-Mo cluster-binding NifX family protein
MRIAVVSDDGRTVSAHFGRARSYLVFETKDGVIQAEETLEKPTRDGRGHAHEAAHDPAHGSGHGHGGADAHRAMLDPIRGCDVVLAGGMGRGMQGHLRAAGIEAMLIAPGPAREAVERLLAGDLTHEAHRLH